MTQCGSVWMGDGGDYEDVLWELGMEGGRSTRAKKMATSYKTDAVKMYIPSQRLIVNYEEWIGRCIPRSEQARTMRPH